MLSGINHVTLAVTDLERSFGFYRDVLRMRPVCLWAEGAYLLAGEAWICLFVDPARDPLPLPDYTHLAFTVSPEDFARLSDEIRRAGAVVWKENISEGDSLYFLDPDGHKLEIHVGDWRSRLRAKKRNPWPGARFFD